MRLPLAIALTTALFTSSCGGGGESMSTAPDPHCASICAIKEPATAGADDICNKASADACTQACNTLTAGAVATCGDCLLKGAHFGAEDVMGGDISCADSMECTGGSQCTVTGRTGQCKYCEDNMKATQDCYITVNPRREVECKSTFRAADECSAVCTAK